MTVELKVLFTLYMSHLYFRNVTDYMTDKVNYVITSAPWDDNFDDVSVFFINNSIVKYMLWYTDQTLHRGNLEDKEQYNSHRTGSMVVHLPRVHAIPKVKNILFAS